MRGKQIAVRAAFVCAAAGITLAAWSATEDTAAHAADHRPAAVEHPGGLLDHLPEQAADRAHEVVDQVVPDKPRRDQPAAGKPRKDPKPPPAAPVVEVPPVVVETPPVLEPVLPVVETPPVVVPAPTEPAPTEPIVITLPDAGDTPAVPAPTLAVPSVPLGALPILGANTVPTPASPPTITEQLATALTSAGPSDPAVCGPDPADVRRISRDALRALLGVHDGPAAAADQARPAKPCPTTPVDEACTGLTVAKTSARDGLSLVASTIPATAGELILRRLGVLLPRSDLPASRATHLDPRPA